jgi:hypothetical protein
VSNLTSLGEIFQEWKNIAKEPIKQYVFTKHLLIGKYDYDYPKIIPSFLIPHPLVRTNRYISFEEQETFKDEFLVTARQAKVEIESELTGVAIDILKKDPQFYNQNTSAWTGITSNRQKQQGIHRQLEKIKQHKHSLEHVLDKDKEHIDTIRMIWRQHRMRKLKAVIDTPKQEAYNNAIRYRVDHDDSSLMPGLKYKNTNLAMVHEMVDIMQEDYAPAMLSLYENTDLETIGYYKGKRVKGIRHKPGEVNLALNGKSMKVIEECYQSRDISGIPGGSQENLPIYGEELERIDSQLVSDLQQVTPFEIYTPYKDSREMWRMLDDNKDLIRAYDGSNWQSYVAMTLMDLTINISEGWILLSSGHTETSPAGFTAMVGLIGTETIQGIFPIDKGAFYGDDLSAIQNENHLPSQLIPGIIEESEKDTARGVHLGMSLKHQRVNAGKLVTDRPGNFFKFKNKPITLNGYTRYSDIQKTAIAIQYGLIPFKNPISYLKAFKITDLYDKDSVFLSITTKDKEFPEMLAYYQSKLKPRWN